MDFRIKSWYIFLSLQVGVMFAASGFIVIEFCNVVRMCLTRHCINVTDVGVEHDDCELEGDVNGQPL